MSDILLDTTVCIDLLRGARVAREYAVAGRAAGRVLLHTAVLAELFEGARGRSEFKAIDALVASTVGVVPSAHDLSASIALLRRHQSVSGTQWHGCLIAATGLRLGASVATHNEKHFRVFRGLKGVRPY